MKKVSTVILITIILIGSSCDKKTNDYYPLSFKNIESCNNELIERGEYNNKKVYTFCITEPDIKIENKKYKLSSALNDEIISIDAIFTKIKDYSVFDDGGSKLYKAEGYNILACNTLSGSTDIIIGNNEMLYYDIFCTTETD